MLNEQITTNVGPSSIEIAYERRGNSSDPVLLLIIGGGAQLVHWPGNASPITSPRSCDVAKR